MDNQIQKLAPEIKKVIDNCQNILLHLHPGPDGDSVGSSLSWMHILKSLGKNVTVISGDDDPPKYLSFLPGFSDIEIKNFLEIDQSKYDLFIINDSGGIEMVSQKGEVKFAPNLKTIVIDHHITNPGYGQINLITDTISNCENLFYLFNELDYEITPNVGRCLFMGMYTDSGGFKYQKVSPRTFVAASKLVEIYPDFYKDLFELTNNNEGWELELEGYLLSHIEKYFDGKVGLSGISFEEMQKRNIPPKDAHGSMVTNKIISVKGRMIGAVLTEKFQGKTMISFRTRNSETYDVSKIAVVLGGGGHKAAAGARIDAPLPEAKRKLLEAIVKVYPELGKI